MAIDVITLALAAKRTDLAISSALTGIANIELDDSKTKIIVTTNDSQIFELDIANQLTDDEYSIISSLSTIDDKLYFNSKPIGDGLIKDKEQLDLLNSIVDKVDKKYVDNNFAFKNEVYNKDDIDNKLDLYASSNNLDTHINDKNNPHETSILSLK